MSKQGIRNDCDCFAPASRSREICEGRAGLPLRSVNRVRNRVGLRPLREDEIVISQTTRSPAGPRTASPTTLRITSESIARVRTTINKPSEANAGGCCGGTQPRKTNLTKPVLGNGPGTRLVNSFKKMGAPECPACFSLAEKMNSWGIVGCQQRIDEIVADILPRALAWEREKLGWASKLVPESLTESGIRAIVLRAIINTRDPGPSKLTPARPSKHVRGWPYGNAPPVETIPLENPVRHLTYHVWPVKGHGAWQWNCDRLLEYAELFNGRRIVAIVQGQGADSADVVKEYLKGFTDEFIVMPNNSRLREGVTWVPMLGRLQQHQSENDVTFSCHAKGVKHKINLADSAGSTIYRWTSAMYELCLNWEVVLPLLQKNGTVGAFRRYNSARRGGFGPWHYSGSFYWWRNKDAFARDWKRVPETFFATEAWPGYVFKDTESGLILFDKTADLYKLNYWQETIEPELQRWRERHGIQLNPQ